jgi:transcriptional regulator with XRE-family HTH domain
MSEPGPQLHPDLNPASRRYGELVLELGRKVGFNRGWQSRAARRLGVSRSYISKIVSGAYFRVGAEAFDRAVDRGLIPEVEEDLLLSEGPDAQFALAPLWEKLLELAERLIAVELASDESQVRTRVVALADAVMSLELVEEARAILEAEEAGDMETVRARALRLAIQVQAYARALGVNSTVNR